MVEEEGWLERMSQSMSVRRFLVEAEDFYLCTGEQTLVPRQSDRYAGSVRVNLYIFG